MSAASTILPAAAWRDREGLAALCAALGAAAGEARFVGGAVRDTLLGHPVQDVDIATVHHPKAVMSRIREAGFKAIPTGIDHGTVTAIVTGWPVEVTTLRRDVTTDGRRATVAFADDWREDAARRDFTINALYADPLSGAIEDYFGGLADLAAGRVRFIGDPAARIAEDHLRILRFFRFTARFGTLDPESADYRACVAHANSLMALSRERIADELMKLLALADPLPVVRAMVADGVLHPVLPEVDLAGVTMLEQLLAHERATGTEADAPRRLAALLPRDPTVAEGVAARLRLSNKLRARLATAAAPTPGAPDARTLAYRIGVTGALDLILLGRHGVPADMTMIQDWSPPRLPISGGDLIALGLPAGPEVARMLRAVEEDWVAAGFPDGEAVRAMAVQRVAGALHSRQN